MVDFDTIAKRLAGDLETAFPLWDEMDHAACIGNIAHECNGFRSMQEIHPTVAGSKGGLGYAQWTGPRRRAFEAWCHNESRSTSSYEGNAGFLIYELRTSQAGAINATRRGKTLYDKVVNFEMAFERAGVKHYDSRLKYAQRVLAVIGPVKKLPAAVEAIKPDPGHASMATSTIGNTAAGGGLATAAIGAKVVVDQVSDAKDTVSSAGALFGVSGNLALIVGLVVVVVAAFGYIWWRRRQALIETGM